MRMVHNFDVVILKFGRRRGTTHFNICKGVFKWR
jgi:hypothetical protein